MSAPDDAPRIGNRYRLDQRIGAGAMGAVWRGTDELLNRTVAVKELLAAAEPPTAAGVDALEESRQRLMREGRIGARLQHPHVISMFDVVVHEDRPWLVMEYLPSKSLAAMLTEKGPLEPRVVAEIGRQVADGLAAAHAAGVVHRDVKPGNVLIAEDGRVKLTDFGVSRAVDDVQLTRTGLIAGTPAFLSPEVARGQEPTAASDVFALGATLYAAVEGRPPFGLDDNAYALLHKVATGTVDPPQQAGPLTALVMRLLSDDAKERPTASQARDALTPIAEGKPPASGNPSTGTAVLDVGAAAVAAAVAGPSVADPAPEQVATAAALPPAPPPPVRPTGGGAAGGAGGEAPATVRRRPLLIALAAVLVVGLGVLAAVLTSGTDPGRARRHPRRRPPPRLPPRRPPSPRRARLRPRRPRPRRRRSRRRPADDHHGHRVGARDRSRGASSRASTGCCRATRTPRGRCSARRRRASRAAAAGSTASTADCRAGVGGGPAGERQHGDGDDRVHAQGRPGQPRGLHVRRRHPGRPAGHRVVQPLSTDRTAQAVCSPTSSRCPVTQRTTSRTNSTRFSVLCTSWPSSSNSRKPGDAPRSRSASTICSASTIGTFVS